MKWLLRIHPVRRDRAQSRAAVSMVDGPSLALDLIDALQARGGLNGYELIPASSPICAKGLAA